ncbi:MAG: hypothetical protein KUG62_04085 [Rhodobacteraceae bacterium]|nr:hypothetical protein [Paracoccaceae bacterium]
MSNVIQLNVPCQSQGVISRRNALISSFAQHRRFGDDVFWLKENAELLNILECSGETLDEQALEIHQGFYQQIEKRMGFFPQYYRFLLSICLDLEDLGMPGSKGEALSDWVSREELVDSELSDLQRFEARRLMQRRGIEPLPDDTGLEDRVRSFMDRSDTFTMPNKKAAYELTHIVFYLSEYGRRDPDLSPAAITSLEFAGLLAYLEQNVDLLAEICVALRFANQTPSPIWENWLQREAHRFVVNKGPQVDTQDEYHEFFVSNWLMKVSGQDAFFKETTFERMSFHRAESFSGPLRDMSECIFHLQDERSNDWHSMRPHVQGMLTDIGYDILTEAENSSDKFEEFFAGFARTGLKGVAL